MKTLKIIFFVPFLFTAIFSLGQNNVNITDPRLDFKLPTQNGDSLQLSSLKGKVFVLDFWASWCGPCRVANKSMVKLYSKYKDKGFEILSVSIDDNSKDWKHAMKADKLTWLQVNDDGGWTSSTATKWQINSIPFTFVVDKNGNIVAYDLDKQELENKIRELLGL
jgi:thiol-disulfide isomerase/thioredoxin